MVGFKKALLNAGAEMVLGLDFRAEGVSVKAGNSVEDEVAAAGE